MVNRAIKGREEVPIDQGRRRHIQVLAQTLKGALAYVDTKSGNIPVVISRIGLIMVFTNLESDFQKGTW
jgi:hypothetical protein